MGRNSCAMRPLSSRESRLSGGFPLGMVLGLVFSLVLTGCAAKIPPVGEVQDLRVLPQDVGTYVRHFGMEEPLITADRQQELAARFLDIHFSPWNDTDLTADDTDLFWGLRRYQGREVFGENLLPQPAGWLEEMARRSAPDLFPMLVHPAITVVPTSLRVLPTHRPVFNDPASPGQGFPFDYLQNSLVPAGTPVRVVHTSLDGAWYLVKAAHVSGWVRPWEVAWVDQGFMDAYRASELIALIRDDAAITTAEGMYALHGRVGMLLPRSSEFPPPGKVAVRAPQRRADGWAELKDARIAGEQVAPWPLAATADKYVQVLNGLLGQAYGWGGMYENRDCSALIQDVQALFGITMPRNSRAQAQAGRVVNLEGLSAVRKEQVVLEQGVPLLTIVNMPGHVMLYLGPDPVSGRPVVLHSIWGLRIREAQRRESPSATPGRWVLGRTVITTLTPGAELRNLVKPQGLLVERVGSMTLLDDF